MPLFNSFQVAKITQAAEKSKQVLSEPKKGSMARSDELNRISDKVSEYFAESNAILIQSIDELHEYVNKVIECGWAGIDTETTGLDRINDTIVGASLYYPGGVECYIPSKHIVPIFDEPYKNQLSYEEIRSEFLRMKDAGVKLIFANADFDLAMIYKDLKVDFVDNCFYDVILAWRCLKEDEKHNRLKELYNKYVLKGKGDPKKFSDFFTPALFPYCKPEIAKLYAANDAYITFRLFQWQLPYVTKDNPKCIRSNLQKIADLIWNVEIPLIKVCQQLHRNGIYLDLDAAKSLHTYYKNIEDKETEKLQNMVQELLNNSPKFSKQCPFVSGNQFNPNSTVHVKYLIYDLLKVPSSSGNQGTGKEVLSELHLPITDQILKVRSLGVLMSTFVDKLPNAIAPDGRIHAQFKSIGADCIVGSSILPTSQGYRTIEDICESAHCKEAEHVDVDNVVIVNKDQQAEHAQSVIRYTNYPTIKITTECGFSLEGTYNHPIMVSNHDLQNDMTVNELDQQPAFWDGRHFKRLDAVSIGDYVEIPCNYWIGPTTYVDTNLKLHSSCQKISNTQARLPKVYDEAFAEFLGMYYAQGSAAFEDDAYIIRILSDDLDIITELDELSLQLFNVVTSHGIVQSSHNQVETYINCIQIQDIDRILNVTNQRKKIPLSIWSSPKSVINSYIKGLTLNSNLYADKNHSAVFELNIIDEDDARFVQNHLVSQGILCCLEGNRDSANNSYCKLQFNADNYIIFQDIIGFIEGKKYKAVKGCEQVKYIGNRVDNSFGLKVKSIEYKTNTVYDLHVPGTHSFVSNGFISHNTGRMSSADPNLQNIPSHAGNIRHMFRATPAKCEFKECQSNDGAITITLKSFQYVYLDSGHEVKVEDVAVGDKLICESGYGIVIDISQNLSVGDVTLYLEVCNCATSVS